jgi:hypothetical protein
LIGNILQELLDGVKNQRMFDNLVKILQPFPLLDVTRVIHIAASQLPITCRSKAIQAGPVDCLIAAACLEHGFPLLTTDRDFSYIADQSDLVYSLQLDDALRARETTTSIFTSHL